MVGKVSGQTVPFLRGLKPLKKWTRDVCWCVVLDFAAVRALRTENLQEPVCEEALVLRVCTGTGRMSIPENED